MTIGCAYEVVVEILDLESGFGDGHRCRSHGSTPYHKPEARVWCAPAGAHVQSRFHQRQSLIICAAAAARSGATTWV